MTMLEFDEEASRRIVTTYSTPDVIEQRRTVLATLAPAPGERVLDIGSGPGLLAAELAAAVGAEGAVCGIDISPSMLEIAKRRELPAGSAPVTFAAGDACELPFDDGAFDAAVSTQVYEYVADVPRALAEARRILRPGGRLLVLDTDWDSIVWHTEDVERMERVLAAWEEHLVDARLPRRLGRLLEDAGFTVERRTVAPLLNAGYDPDTYSAGLMGFITAFVSGRQGLTQYDAAAWAQELTTLGADYFFSLNRYLFLAAAT